MLITRNREMEREADGVQQEEERAHHSPILLSVFVKIGMTWQIRDFSHDHADHVKVSLI